VSITDPTPSITCPVCGMRSYHPVDVEMGYCGRCHAYTSPVDVMERAKRFLREADTNNDQQKEAP